MPNLDAVHLWDKRRNIMPLCEIIFFFLHFSPEDWHLPRSNGVDSVS